MKAKQDIFYGALVGSLRNAKHLRGEAFAEKVKREYIRQWESALPDDLPTIPHAVSDYLKKAKAPGKWGLLDVFWHLGDNISAMGVDGLYDWQRWMVDNQDAVSLAWLYGVWIVEETGEVERV